MKNSCNIITLFFISSFSAQNKAVFSYWTILESIFGFRMYVAMNIISLSLFILDKNVGFDGLNDLILYAHHDLMVLDTTTQIK